MRRALIYAVLAALLVLAVAGAEAPRVTVVDLAALPSPTPIVRSYVLNTGTGKFHRPACASVEEMSAAHRQPLDGTREALIALGYSPCGRCHP